MLMHHRSQDTPLAARCQLPVGVPSCRQETATAGFYCHKTERSADAVADVWHSVDTTPVSPLPSLFLCTHQTMTSSSTHVCAVPVSREHMGIEHRSSRIAVARMRGRAQRIAEHRRSASRPPRTRRPDRGAATISGCITANTVLAS